MQSESDQRDASTSQDDVAIAPPSTASQALDYSGDILVVQDGSGTSDALPPPSPVLTSPGGDEEVYVDVIPALYAGRMTRSRAAALSGAQPLPSSPRRFRVKPGWQAHSGRHLSCPVHAAECLSSNSSDHSVCRQDCSG